VWALRGDAGRAHDAWERLRTFPKSMPVPPRVLAEARLYLALADGADRAVLERRFADVATIDRNLLWTAWAQVNVSERTRDRDGFRAAIETFERAESRVMAARARKRANALGFRFAVSLAERDVLTPRELAAARLVAKGKTNKEISTMLDMSPKTVAHHVAAILMKTGMRSRVEIAAHVAAGKPFAASDFSSN
jgi:DNA-binding CsgD family transcriptional regulator